MALNTQLPINLAERWQRDWLLGRGWFLMGLLFTWIAIAILGMIAVWRYETSTGSQATTPLHWPSHALVAPQPQRNTLLVFAHPKCPCTRATLEQLTTLATTSKATTDTHIVFFKPGSDRGEWEQSELCQLARQQTAWQVCFDSDGAQAKMFGAQTSGHAFLYDAAGQLTFSGGVTRARGQAGSNESIMALEQQLTHQTGSLLQQTSIFGCSLQTPSKSTEGALCPKP